MIKNFNDVFETLKAKGICKRMVVAWGVDEHSIEAAYKAVEKRRPFRWFTTERPMCS